MTRLFFIILITILVACNKEDKQPPVVYTYPVTDVTLRQASSGGYIEENGGSEIIRRGMIWNTSGKATLSSYEGIKEEGAGSGEFISLITSLEPGKNYYIKAFATNHTETGYGQEFTFTTGIGNVEIDMEIENISFFSVTAHCFLHPDAEVIISDRGFIWNVGSNAPDPTIEDHAGKFSKGPGNSSFSAEVSGLSSYKEYSLRAYAINSTGTFYTESVSFTTLVVEDGTPGEVTDIDGNIYPTITLGGIEWMAENLRTKKFNDGTPIPEVPNSQEWANLESPGMTWYNNAENLWGQDYGALYNGHAVLTHKLCPTGWFVTNFTEFTNNLTWYLSEEYGFSNQGGDTEKLTGNVLKSCRQKNSPLGGECETSEHPRWNANSTHYGNDLFGFSALPGGYRSANGTFSNIGEHGLWWITVDWGSYQRVIIYRIQATSGQLNITDRDKSNGLSVRCVRDVTE